MQVRALRVQFFLMTAQNKITLKGKIMKHLITIAAVAALLTVSACKKAEKVEEPATTQETTEQAAAAVETAEAAVEAPVEAVKAE